MTSTILTKSDSLLDDLREACHARVVRFLLPTLGHGVRAPLNGMIINLELLKELVKPGVEQDEQVVARRERSVAALGRTVNQLRAAVESVLAQASVSAIHNGRFDLREVLQDAATVLRPQAVVQHVGFESTLPEQPAHVAGNPGHVKQAILNLGVNALEAMPAGGEMTMGIDRDDSAWVVSVVDAGPGIADDVLAKVMTMHFSTKAERSGIGLYVTRSIAEGHGGRLEIDSRLGSGTRARLRFPAAPERR